MVRLGDEAANGLPDGIPTPRIISGVGKGWWPIVSEIHTKLSEIDPNYSVDQIKEKFGGLRYYYTPSVSLDDVYERMQAVVDAGEARARKTCEWCGVPAPGPRRRTGAGGFSWLLTLCDEHQRERDNVG